MYPNKSVCRNLNDVLCTQPKYRPVCRVLQYRSCTYSARTGVIGKICKKPEQEPEAGSAYTGDGFTALLFVSYLAVGVDLVQMLDRYA